MLLSAARIGHARKPAELAGNLVVMALLKDAPGHGEPARDVPVAGIGSQLRRQRFHLAARGAWLADAGAAEHHDGGTDTVLLKQQLGFLVVDLQAHAAHAVRGHEIHIVVGAAVARAIEDRGDALRRPRVFIRRFRPVPG